MVVRAVRQTRRPTRSTLPRSRLGLRERATFGRRASCRRREEYGRGGECREPRFRAVGFAVSTPLTRTTRRSVDLGRAHGLSLARESDARRAAATPAFATSTLARRGPESPLRPGAIRFAARTLSRVLIASSLLLRGGGRRDSTRGFAAQNTRRRREGRSSADDRTRRSSRFDDSRYVYIYVSIL